MQPEPEDYYRTEYTGDARFPHSINIDTRRRNQYRDHGEVDWLRGGLYLGYVCLIGLLVRWMIQ